MHSHKPNPLVVTLTPLDPDEQDPEAMEAKEEEEIEEPEVGENAAVKNKDVGQ